MVSTSEPREIVIVAFFIVFAKASCDATTIAIMENAASVNSNFLMASSLSLLPFVQTAGSCSFTRWPWVPWACQPWGSFSNTPRAVNSAFPPAFSSAAGGRMGPRGREPGRDFAARREAALAADRNRGQQVFDAGVSGDRLRLARDQLADI